MREEKEKKEKREGRKEGKKEMRKGVWAYPIKFLIKKGLGNFVKKALSFYNRVIKLN